MPLKLPINAVTVHVDFQVSEYSSYRQLAIRSVMSG